MTDDPDPLEAELRAFRPIPLSSALRRRIGERLAARRRWPRLALAGGLVAAGVALVAMLGNGRRPPASGVGPPAVAGRTPPTVQAYRRAAAESPTALDALLDRQAVANQPNPPARPAAAFNRTLLTWRGDR